MKSGPRTTVEVPRPLSHHDILALVAPFTRVGRRVDLQSSDRAAGCLRFAPLVRQAGDLTVRETLCLHCFAGDRYRLVRTTTPCEAGPAFGGLDAVLEVGGGRPPALLARLDDLPPQRQWSCGPGFVVATSHHAAERGEPTVSGADLRVDGLSLTATPPGRGRGSAKLELRPCGRVVASLPDDLLAVLGRAWSPLRQGADAWRASVRLRRKGPDLTARLLQAAPHLATSLAEPPPRFHPRLRLRRWAVAARRAVPLLLWTTLPALAVCAPELYAARSTAWPPLLLALPPLLLAAHLLTAEGPSLERPWWPRALPASAW